MRSTEKMLTVTPLFLFCLIAIVPILEITRHVSASPNEGWNAYHTIAAMHHGTLYPALESFTTNQYPPLSFYIVGLLGGIIGDEIIAGRIIALLSLAIVARNICVISSWVGLSPDLALFSTGLFLIIFALIGYPYIAMDDPQLLADALVTYAAILFLKDAPGKPRDGRIIAAAFLTILGLLVKHILVGLPLALCIWAAFYDRRRLLVYVVSAAVLAAVAASILYGIWGNDIIDAMLHSPRRISWTRAAASTWSVIRHLFLPLIPLAIAGCYLNRQSIKAQFIAIYCLCSILTGVPLFAGDGTSCNVVFDVFMATAIACTLLVSAINNKRTALGGISLFVALKTVYLLTIYQPDYYPSLIRPDRASAELIQILHDAPGPVASADLGLTYWAGKPESLDFFNYGQKIATGAVNGSALLNLIDRKYFSLIVGKRDGSFISPSAARELAGHYVLVRTYPNLLLYAPR